MFIIGLTGGIGSGKSTIAKHFTDLGVPGIDADQTAREVVQPGEPALAAISQHFGQEVIQTDGTLDRRRLREKVFTDPSARAWLNNLLHPLIRQRMLQQCREAQGPYCILMIPLLFENHLQSLVHRTLVVDVDEATQIRRTMRRDNTTEEQVKAIIAAQCPRRQRLALADDVIQNGDDVTATQRQQAVYALHQTYLQLAAQHQSHG